MHFCNNIEENQYLQMGWKSSIPPGLFLQYYFLLAVAIIITNHIALSREVVTDLIEEYKAAERPDYVNWGSESHSVSGNSRDRKSVEQDDP